MIFDTHSDLLFDVVLKRKQGFKHVIRDFHLHKLKDYLGIVATIYFEGNNSHFELIEALHFIHEEVEENKDYFNFIFSYQDINLDNGKLNIVLAIEGLAPLRHLTDINIIYSAGIRQISLTWNDKNLLGAGANYFEENDGLTDLGQEVVRYSQKLGIIIDVSHANKKTFYDILKIATKPVIASHSNIYNITNHQRNLLDDQILLIAKSQGLVSITPTFFIELDKDKRDIKKMMEHFNYLKKLAGVDYIGVGNDFMDFLPEYQSGSMVAGLNSSKDAYKLINAIKQNFNDEESKKIFYLNYLRVLSLCLK